MFCVWYALLPLKVRVSSASAGSEEAEDFRGEGEAAVRPGENRTAVSCSESTGKCFV